MAEIDNDKVSACIRNVAASRIMPRFQQLQAHEISSKSSPSDLVTIADIEAEIDLTRLFKDLLPGSDVVGEEAVSKGEGSINILLQSDRPVWVIDPVDGTGNFVNGRTNFGTIVALVQNGETTHSWIYDIPGDRMCIAGKGSGVTLNGGMAPKLMSRARDLNDMKGFVSTRFVPKEMRPAVESKLKNFSETTAWFCCAHEYLSLAKGERDFSFYSRIKPWDHLGGVLTFAEAGGYSRKWDGSEYVPGDEEGGIINAADEETWEKLRELFLS